MSNLFSKSNRVIKSRPVTKTYDNPVDNGVKRGQTYRYFTKSLQKAFLDEPIYQVTFDIQKGADISKSLYLEGVASDNRVDFEGDRMHERALQSMNRQVNVLTLPLMYGHTNIQLGQLVGSKVDNGRLLIRTILEENNPAVNELLRRMDHGQSFGFSIGGEGSGRILPNNMREITDVRLKEISVVEVPANPRAKIMNVVDKNA
jgi:hypothetical protein